MQSMEQIYEEYFETVRKYLYCLTNNGDMAEELTQETFYQAVKSIHSFKGNCKMSVWLCQIAKNLWYNELKKRRKYKEIKEEDWLNMKIQSQWETENLTISKDEKLTLYKKLQQLDEKTREVMYLRITGELSFKEIGSVLNQTDTWARVTFYRGKKKLKEADENESKKRL